MCKYCLECEWVATTMDGCSEAEVSRQAIEHFVETGHPVGSVDITAQDPTSW